MPCPVHLTCYLQQNLGLRADDDWAAFLAALAGIALGVPQVALRLSARFGARRVIPVGMALAVLGLA
jgi:hypothetical protein